MCHNPHLTLSPHHREQREPVCVVRMSRSPCKRHRKQRDTEWHTNKSHGGSFAVLSLHLHPPQKQLPKHTLVRHRSNTEGEGSLIHSDWSSAPGPRVGMWPHTHTHAHAVFIVLRLADSHFSKQQRTLLSVHQLIRRGSGSYLWTPSFLDKKQEFQGGEYTM